METWRKPVEGSRMFKVKQKLKWCKHSFIKWRKEKHYNARKEIEIIQQEIEQMQIQEGNRDRDRWKILKSNLEVAYKNEEEFWRKKSRNM